MTKEWDSMKKVILIVCILIVVVFLSFFVANMYQNNLINADYSDVPNSENSYEKSEMQKLVNQDAKEVSIIQLISNPEKYDGELVRVVGVGNLEFEGNFISLSKEDFKYGTGNSIWIELGKGTIPYEEAEQYNGKYVIIEGIFDKDDCGHFDMYRGSIKEINRYELWETD